MTVREEIQITDLEPSIEGGQDVSYVVQIRGIDADGRPGPWSEQFEFTSPEQIPSLESFNYVPGESGWKLNNDGSFEVNDGTIRGTLQSLNYEPGVSGWTLFDNGNVEFSTGIFRGALQIGTNTFNVDSNGNMFIGGSSLNTAPFAVDTNGNIVAMSINAGLITAGTLGANVIYAGNINADQITAGTIGANVVYSGTIVASQISSGTIDGDLIPNLNASKINDGVFDPVRIPNLSADKITSGTINANDVTISGTLSAVTLSGVGGTFSGSLTASTTSANNMRAYSFAGDSLDAFNLTRGAGLLLDADKFVAFGGTTNASGFPRIDNSGGDLRLRSVDYVYLRGTGGVKIENLNYLNISSTNVYYRTDTNILYRTNSSKRFKEDIQDANIGDNILDLRPVTYKAQSDAENDMFNNQRFVGLIAEEVHDLGLDLFVEYDENGDPFNVNYNAIGMALAPHIKDLKNKVIELENKIIEMEGKINGK